MRAGGRAVGHVGLQVLLHCHGNATDIGPLGLLFIRGTFRLSRIPTAPQDGPIVWAHPHEPTWLQTARRWPPLERKELVQCPVLLFYMSQVVGQLFFTCLRKCSLRPEGIRPVIFPQYSFLNCFTFSWFGGVVSTPKTTTTPSFRRDRERSRQLPADLGTQLTLHLNPKPFTPRIRGCRFNPQGLWVLWGWMGFGYGSK